LRINLKKLKMNRMF